MKKVAYLLLFAFGFSCNDKPVSSSDLEYVKANTWVWDHGFKIGEGDFVSFDKNSLVFALKHDTIFFRNQPRAIIKKLNKKNYELFVSSINNKEQGLYLNTAEFTK